MGFAACRGQVMGHWYFDDVAVVERMREVQRQANRAYVLDLKYGGDPMGWRRLRALLGKLQVSLGNRIQRVEPAPRPDLASSSQCGLR